MSEWPPRAPTRWNRSPSRRSRTSPRSGADADFGGMGVDAGGGCGGKTKFQVRAVRDPGCAVTVLC